MLRFPEGLRGSENALTNADGTTTRSNSITAPTTRPIWKYSRCGK